MSIDPVAVSARSIGGRLAAKFGFASNKSVRSPVRTEKLQRYWYACETTARAGRRIAVRLD